MPWPQKYTPDFCQKLLDHMSKGLSFASFAGVVGCTRQGLYTMLEKYPEFKEAYEIGQMKSQLFWEQVGVDHIIETGSGDNGRWETKKLNHGLYNYVMKTRFKEDWGEDAGKIQLGATGGVKIIIEGVSNGNSPEDQ